MSCITTSSIKLEDTHNLGNSTIKDKVSIRWYLNNAHTELRIDGIRCK